MAKDKASILSRIGNALSRAMPVQDPIPRELSTETSNEPRPDWLEMFGVAGDRRSSYQDYAVMERESPIVCSALDAIADTAVSGSEGEAEDAYQVQFDEDEGAPPKGVESAIADLEKRLKIKSNARRTIRDLCHVGDFFEEQVIDPSTMSIVELKPLSPDSIVVVPDELREESDDPKFRQYDTSGKIIAEFQPWQVVQYAHMASRLDVYGRSALYSARRKYRQLQMIEDGMVINRITRSSNHYVWQVPVGDMDPKAAAKYVTDYMSARKRYRRIDPRTGKMIITRNIIDDDVDFAVPVGTKVGTGSVTSITGQAGIDKIDDVMFFLKQLIGALRVPAAYLGFEEDTNGKQVITTIDVAFARTVRSYQKAYGVGIRQVYDTELALKKYRQDSLSYSLVFPAIGTVDEMRRWQVELLKTQVAQVLKSTGLVTDDEYLLRKIVEVEEDEIQKILRRNKKNAEDAVAQQQSNALFQSGLGAVSAMTQQAQSGVSEPGKKRGIGKMREVHVDSSVARAVDQVLYRPGFRKMLDEVRSFAEPVKVTKSDARSMNFEMLVA